MVLGDASSGIGSTDARRGGASRRRRRRCPCASGIRAARRAPGRCWRGSAVIVAGRPRAGQPRSASRGSSRLVSARSSIERRRAARASPPGPAPASRSERSPARSDAGSPGRRPRVARSRPKLSGDEDRLGRRSSACTRGRSPSWSGTSRVRADLERRRRRRSAISRRYSDRTEPGRRPAPRRCASAASGASGSHGRPVVNPAPGPRVQGIGAGTRRGSTTVEPGSPGAPAGRRSRRAGCRRRAGRSPRRSTGTACRGGSASSDRGGPGDRVASPARPPRPRSGVAWRGWSWFESDVGRPAIRPEDRVARARSRRRNAPRSTAARSAPSRRRGGVGAVSSAAVVDRAVEQLADRHPARPLVDDRPELGESVRELGLVAVVDVALPAYHAAPPDRARVRAKVGVLEEHVEHVQPEAVDAAVEPARTTSSTAPPRPPGSRQFRSGCSGRNVCSRTARGRRPRSRPSRRRTNASCSAAAACRRSHGPASRARGTSRRTARSAARARGHEPRMLVAGVVQDEVEDDPDAALRGPPRRAASKSASVPNSGSTPT